ncbi:MAG: DUF1326 domain-containing protein [Pyrinomonadaceae bacterium]
MSEIYAYPARVERKGFRRRVAVLSPVVLLCLIVAGALGAAVFFAASRNNAASRNVAQAGASSNETGEAAASLAKESWMIRGALSETCTCSVPCTCNFGQGPSPHSYCHALYSYDIREGNYGDIPLNGLHFGATDLANGQTIFVDERADARQREALKIIAARVIVHTSPEETVAKVKEITPRVRYAAVKQEYDKRHNLLQVAGIGEFAADYIMGIDDSQPVVVRNNTTWRVKDSIKAKTSVFRVKVGRDAINTKDTNSNQADFEYTDKTDFGKAEHWGCSGSSAGGACNGMDKMHHDGGGNHSEGGAESCHH